MASTVLGGALAQWPLGYLSDTLGRRKTLLAAAAAGAIVSVLVVATAARFGIVGISLLGTAWGAVAFPMYSVSVAHANDYADPSDYVMVSSGLLLMYGGGAIIGPFAASAAMEMVGTSGLYAMTGLVHLSLAIIAFGDALATAYSASQIYEEEILHQAGDED
jgi:MFS family permease